MCGLTLAFVNFCDSDLFLFIPRIEVGILLRTYFLALFTGGLKKHENNQRKFQVHRIQRTLQKLDMRVSQQRHP